MPKLQTRYVCQECGRVFAREMGRCPNCNAWGSLVEEVVAAEPPPSKAGGGLRNLAGTSQPRPLNQIGGDEEDRMTLPMNEFARVLGGGIVPGSIILIGGDPGIGKSTLTLQMCMQMAAGSTVLYVSGE